MKRALSLIGQRLSLLAAMTLAACQSISAQEPVPAVLTSTDVATMDMLKHSISKALGQKSVKFGATDWSSSSIISVLPAQYNPISGPFQQPQAFVKPTLFELMMDADGCYLLQRGTERRIPLENIRCTPLQRV